MLTRTGDPEMAREINRALILDLLRRNETMPRAQIARALNVSKVTVSAVVAQLIEEELVVEVGEGDARKKGGRKPILLSLNTSSKFVIGVDIGYTNTVVAVGNLKGEILAKQRQPTARSHTVEHVVEQVVSLVQTVLSDVHIQQENVLGLGLSVAGTVDSFTGIITFSPDFNWKDVAISELLQQHTGLLTIADNCTRAMARGEIRQICDTGVCNMIYINIGYGIGSALVINGNIYNNHSEFGHVFVTKKDVQCDCGKYGCLEAVASGHAIERQANRILIQPDGSWMTAKTAAGLADRGDETARAIFTEAGRYLGRTISIIANVLNPDKIVLGGGVALAGHLMLDAIFQEVNKHTVDVISRHVKIEMSSLGMDAGVSGALVLALDHFVFKQHSLRGR